MRTIRCTRCKGVFYNIPDAEAHRENGTCQEIVDRMGYDEVTA